MATGPEYSKGARPRPDRRAIAVAVAAIAVVAVLLLILFGSSEPPAPVSETDFRGPEIDIEALSEPLLLPAEFAPQQALILGGTQLAVLFPGLLADIVDAAADSVPVAVLVGSPEDRRAVEDALRGRGLPPDEVSYLEVPVRTMWVRDFGPVAVQDSTGGITLVDFDYRERRGNKLDDTVPRSIAELLGLPRREFPLLLEGGDFIGNGRGLCISSMRIIERNAHYNAYPPEKVGDLLSDALGFEQWIPLEHLQDEPTGHLDMFLTMVAEDVVVVGECDPREDSYNAELLDLIAANFAQIPTRVGHLRVERIPMPPHDDGVWRTYTNVVFANGVLLVPAYPAVCPDLDRRARDIYRRLLPGWRVVGIDCEKLTAMNGALRCVTLNIPRVRAAAVSLP